MQMMLPRVYPVTDRRLSRLSHAEQVARLCDGGATLLQLREKHLSPREFYHEAEAALRVGRERGALVIINDRADLAHVLGADGVHLGQDDLPPDAARRLLGERALIGYSTHSVEQAIDAARLPIDYIAIGPVFATTTKENPDPIIGLEGVRRVREAIGPLPLVAIGGIGTTHARAVIEAGADAVAVVGALFAGADASSIASRMHALLATLRDSGTARNPV
jgi:thiamine-phosphate pyrophosphorylase